MNLRMAVVGMAMALAATGASAGVAGCGSSTSWNSLGPPDVALFGNSFSAAGSYVDCYTFSLNSGANSFGGAIEIDTILNKLSIDVTSVSLYLGDNLIGKDTSPLAFSFGSLAGGGLYTLAVASTVSTDSGWSLFSAPVGYAGLIATIAAPVPEPTALALAVAGLVGVGALARRGRRA